MSSASGSLHYSVRSSLRGADSRSQVLRLLPEYRGLGVIVEARRSQSLPWTVTHAAATLRHGALQLQAGSLDPVWTGGLLVGRAPLLFAASSPGLSGLWQPSRARLRGIRSQFMTRRFQADAFGSVMSDSVWRHRVLGFRLRVSSALCWVEPAWLAQELQRISVTSFAENAWGLSAGTILGAVSFNVQCALARSAPAFQMQANGKHDPAKGRLEYWRIAEGFRNPLAHATGEFDREFIRYPELDTTLANATTGESGGRVYLRTGRTSRFCEVQATIWREHAFQPAGVRLEAAAQSGDSFRKVRLAYLHQQRPGFEFSRRHQVDLDGQYRNLHGEVGGRWTQIAPESLPRVGGHAAAGFRVHAAGTGLWEAGMAWDVYDLSLASGRFVTLRIHHSLPLGHGELAWHLRWRSAYASHAAALSLQVDSSVYL